MQMHNRLGSWVNFPCHIHFGGALKMIESKNVHSWSCKVNDHIWDIKDNIIQASIKVEYDQTHDHQCLTGNCIVSQAIKSKQV